MSSDEKHLSHARTSAYIDGELSIDDGHSLEQHLTTCHACALQLLAATKVRSASTQASGRFAVPPEAISRLAAQLRTSSSKTRVPQHSLQRWSWSALAAGLVVAISLLTWHETRNSNSSSAELLDQHLAVLASGSPPQILSSDRHTVKPWFQGKLPFSFNLPDIFPAETTLKGGNMAYLQGRPAALLLFTIGKHQVSVFITQKSPSDSAFSLSSTQAGFNVQTATTADLRIVGISDVNSSDLSRLTSALAAAQ